MTYDLSVIIPCHNEAETLGQQLDALVQETWHGSWEIVVVDNASTDDTATVARSYADGPVPIRVVTAVDGRGVGYARNAGAATSTARSIAFCDGDDVVLPGWVSEMGYALETQALVSSRLDVSILNPAWLANSRPTPRTGLPLFAGLPFAHGGACGMRRAVWERLGGYDGTYEGVEDIEFGLKAHAAGIAPVRAGAATVAYRLRDDLRSVWRQGRNYGRRRPALAARAAELGLTPPRRRAGFKSLVWLAVRVPTLVTRRGRFAWTWTLASRVGVAQGAMEFRRERRAVQELALA